MDNDMGTPTIKKVPDNDMGTPPIKNAPDDDMGTPPSKKAPDDNMGTLPIKKAPDEDMGTPAIKKAQDDNMELAAKRAVRKDKNYRKTEAESKKSQRNNSDLRQIERRRELFSKREARKNKDFTKKELAAKKKQLPRGGQLSVKGNVVNMPVEVQHTIYSLPHTLEKSGTISFKLKRKLVFKKCDFSENVGPFAVICALHYLMRTSDLYKSSGIEINEDWITEIAK
ncbi:unnamed protein product [Mytilus coruscus]|uniref:DUF6570 domain-containing protein n=1 Tax=Mytilus coruscus TaxID=42192 RepID=A0A6J8DFE5_MYTCO|nr:unnamed protein product [Mytilus coruscus]